MKLAAHTTITARTAASANRRSTAKRARVDAAAFDAAAAGPEGAADVDPGTDKRTPAGRSAGVESRAGGSASVSRPGGRSGVAGVAIELEQLLVVLFGELQPDEQARQDGERDDDQRRERDAESDGDGLECLHEES